MSGNTQRSLSLVIPAYNEVHGIAQAIDEADLALSRLADRYEVLIVDDGSKDGTHDRAVEAAGNRSHIRVLRHPTNRGYGAALRTGFEAASHERIAFTDADCQFDLNDLAEMVAMADSVPIVVGYRVDRKDPWRRRFLSRGYNLIARTLLGTRVRDCDCALKVFRKTELSHLLPESRNFFVNTEMLSRAAQKGLAIAEIGVKHRPRLHGTSKVSMGDVPKTLATLIPYWWTNVLFGGGIRTAAPSSFSWLPLLFLLAIASILLFGRIGVPLLEPEEARYAEIPRQMLNDGHWLVPHLNGQPYLDKPPLLYWSVILSYKLFGVHDWAARIVPACAGLLTIVLSYLWASRTIGARAGFFGALVLCFSIKFIYMGRLLTMNGPLALMTTAGFAFLHWGFLSHAWKQRLTWMCAAGAVCGLGMLIKGPVALLLVVPPMLVLLRLDPRYTRPGLTGWLIFAMTAIGIAGPWYAYLCATEPGFASYFFWTHNLVRFLQPFDHQGPVWQYFPGFILGSMPWILLVIPAIRWLFRRDEQVTASRPAALGAFLLAFVWMVAFFSMSGSKRPGYLVPVFPPLAMAIGCYMDAVLPHRRLSGIWTSLTAIRHRHAYIMSAGAVAVAVAFSAGTLIAGAKSPDKVILYMVGSMVGWIFFLGRSPGQKHSWAREFVAAFIVAGLGVHGFLPDYTRRFSLRHSVRSQLAKASGAPVICYPHVWDSVNFYGDHPEIIAFNRDERREMIRHLETRSSALVMIQTKYLDEILQDLPIMMEFYSRQVEGGVTIGEIRQRRIAGKLIASRASTPETSHETIAER